jgi:hypothetical protein
LEVAVFLEATRMLEVHGFVLNFIAQVPGQVLPDNSGTQVNIKYVLHVKIIFNDCCFIINF